MSLCVTSISFLRPWPRPKFPAAVFLSTYALCGAMYARIVVLQQRRQLLLWRLDQYETIPQSVLSGVLPEIPTQMFTRHSNSRFIAVKVVQVFEVGAHNITYFFQRQS